MRCGGRCRAWSTSFIRRRWRRCRGVSSIRLDTNSACVTGTVTLLDQARRAGVRRVVYAGSSSAYGDQPQFVEARNRSARAALAVCGGQTGAEMYCQAFYHTYGLETVTIRYFNVFGPRQDPASPYSAVIPLFITAMLQGQRPKVYGDGLQSRDFTFVENVVHGNLLAMDTCSSRRARSVLQCGQRPRDDRCWS